MERRKKERRSHQATQCMPDMVSATTQVCDNEFDKMVKVVVTPSAGGRTGGLGVGFAQVGCGCQQRAIQEAATQTVPGDVGEERALVARTSAWIRRQSRDRCVHPSSWDMRIFESDKYMEQGKRGMLGAVVFDGEMPCFPGGEGTVQALSNARLCQLDYSSRSMTNFVEEEHDEVLRFDYKDSAWKHFAPRDHVRGSADEWRQAWLRREMRGLWITRDGTVAVRGLHKFFTLGQCFEATAERAVETGVAEVLEKLDGQMINGVICQQDGGGQMVRYWTRRAETQVGEEAQRVAAQADGRYDDFVKQMHGRSRTAVFELVGKQSRIKANEGAAGRLVLIAVREKCTGRYARHEEMMEWARPFGVEVVRRMTELESVEFEEMCRRVHAWQGREGVVVHLRDGTVMKIKSKWWQQTSLTRELRCTARVNAVKATAKLEREKESMNTVGQRLVLLKNAQGSVWITAQEVAQCVDEVRKVDLVFENQSGYRGRQTAAVARFRTVEHREAAAARLAVKGWTVRPAYSKRTRNSKTRLVESWTFEPSTD